MVLMMNAVTFFTMLNQLYKLQAENSLRAIHIASIPHLKQADAEKAIDSYKRMSSDMMELGERDDDFSALHDLKQKL